MAKAKGKTGLPARRTKVPAKRPPVPSRRLETRVLDPRFEVAKLIAIIGAARTVGSKSISARIATGDIALDGAIVDEMRSQGYKVNRQPDGLWHIIW